MGIGTSLLLVAIGAILKWAVTDTVAGISLATVGVILMIVGVVGLIISLVWLTAWRDRARGTVVRERYVDQAPWPDLGKHPCHREPPPGGSRSFISDRRRRHAGSARSRSGRSGRRPGP